MGIVIGWGNLNGIVSSNIYRTKPQYYSGHGTVLGYLVAFLFFGSIVTRQLLERENKKRLRGERDHWVEGLTEEQIAQKASGDEKYNCPSSHYSFLADNVAGRISSTLCNIVHCLMSVPCIYTDIIIDHVSFCVHGLILEILRLM